MTPVDIGVDIDIEKDFHYTILPEGKHTTLATSPLITTNRTA